MSLALWVYAAPFANNELAIPDSDIVTTLVAVLEPMGFGHAVATVRRSVGLSSWMPSHSSTGMLRNCYDGGTMNLTVSMLLFLSLAISCAGAPPPETLAQCPR
ncbi:MAG: hypothetical protein OSB60_13335, partial [Myxococcota bacterium]|nr:hypothetical protein [Myxococcota bacterium]